MDTNEAVRDILERWRERAGHDPKWSTSTICWTSWNRWYQFVEGRMGQERIPKEFYYTLRNLASQSGYAAFAKACGAKGYTITEAEELRPVVSAALEMNRPVIVNAVVNAGELT